MATHLGAKVLKLDELRERKRLRSYQDRLDLALRSNREALSRLFGTGALFSKQGAKVGRDLLQAHQHLLRVLTLIDELTDQGSVPASRKRADPATLYAELDRLLQRTFTLTTRANPFVAKIR